MYFIYLYCGKSFYAIYKGIQLDYITSNSKHNAMTHLTTTTVCTSVIMNIFEGSKSCFYHNKNSKQSFVISCLSLWPLVGASLTTLRRSYMFSFDYQRKIYPWQHEFYTRPYFIFNCELHILLLKDRSSLRRKTNINTSLQRSLLYVFSYQTAALITKSVKLIWK